MNVRLSKAWQPLSEEAIASLLAQLGVYQLANQQSEVLAIGFAGARHPFGIRTALAEEIDRLAELGETATQYRYEFTSNYRSRWNELLMLHIAEFGELPATQGERPSRIGRLNPAGTTSPAGAENPANSTSPASQAE